MKKYDLKVLAIIFIIGMVVFLVSDTITQNKTQAIKNQKYKIYAQNIQDDIKNLIASKQELTYSIALSLSKSDTLIRALRTNDSSLIKLKEFSQQLSHTTSLQNAWFQINDKKGRSFYRSWRKSGGDLTNIRPDLVKMLEKPKVMNTISTGKFDMTFKSMVPIFSEDNSEFLGVFELITHFNSIVQQLYDSSKVHSVVLVDKKYKKQLIDPFSKTFVKDYYVANINAKPDLLQYLGQNGVENFFNITKDYRIDQKHNFFIVTYDIPDIHGDPMGRMVAFKPLDSLSMEDIEYVKSNMIFYIALIILALALIGYYLVVSKHTMELDARVKKRTKELHNEKQYIQTILDTNPSIILVTKDSKIVRANKTFLNFFEYDLLEQFQANHRCICDFFLSIDEYPFDQDTLEINGTQWAQYLVDNAKAEHFVTLEYKGAAYHLMISALPLKNNDETLLTLQDITDLRNKDRLLFEQSKLASMGEMIGNIAHQWRQPLSIISSGATGMKLQKQFDTLTDQIFYETCDLIDSNAQYLSKTINDFRDFIKDNREKKQFILNDELEKFLNLVNSSIKTHQIELILDIQDNLHMEGYPNELIQCFMNFFNNAKDALKQKDEESRILKITAKSHNGSAQIVFQDSGGGIDKKIMEKIFEPYFTTKHQSVGTGLGLHMNHKMIVGGMSGFINVSNKKFVYNDKNYFGAEFVVVLPLS